MARGANDLLIRVDREVQAWERLRPERQFSGLTVTQYKGAADASRRARQDIKELEASLQGAKKRLKLADAELLKVERRVVLSVRGDGEDGEDSVLYGEMGFVPRSQRTRRVRRRSTNGVKAPSAGPIPVPPSVPEKVA